MEKVYLKYDDNHPYVECDYGFVKELIYLGCIYPYKKKDLKFTLIILSFQVSAIVLLLILLNVSIIVKLLLSIVMIFIINFLFACNYNMLVIENLLKEGYYPFDYDSSDKLLKKGIYFKRQ